MKINSFNNFQTLFYEAVENSKNLAPFYAKVDGFGIYQNKDKNYLTVSFSYTEVTGIHRYGKVQFPSVDLSYGDIDALVEEAVMVFIYQLSMSYPGFVAWELDGAMSAALEYYETEDIPESVEREWFGVAYDPSDKKKETPVLFTVGMSEDDRGKFLHVCSPCEEYIKIFDVDGDFHIKDMVAEVVNEFFGKQE